LFEGVSNTDGSNVNLVGNSLIVSSTDSNFLLGGLNGDAASSAYFNQTVELSTPAGQSFQFLGSIHDNTTAGGILKSGGGVLTLGGVNDFTGNTTIAAGNLILTQSAVLPTDVAVQSGAQFSGNGTVLGDVNNQGTIYPGQSVGTLSINGDYTQGSAATYLLQVSGGSTPGGTGLCSLIEIGGTATLGGTVEVISANGTFAVGREYIILTADGGLNGTTFAGVSAINPFLVPSLYYDPNQSAILTLATQFVKGAKTQNELNVAKQLDGIAVPNTDESIVFNNLLALNQLQMPDALEQLTGEQYAYFVEVNQYMDQRLSRRLFDAIRNELDPCACKLECGCFDAWGAFDVGYGHSSNSSKAKGFHTWDIDVTIGAHTYCLPCLLVGGAVNFESNFFKFNLGGQPTMYSYQGALYGTYTYDMFYVYSDLVVGQSYTHFKRPIHFAALDRHAKSTPRLTHGLCYLEAGFNAWDECPLVQPFVGVDFDYVYSAALHEKGADSLNLHIKSKCVTCWDSYLGVHIKEQWDDCWNINLDLAWQHRFGASGTNLNTYFEDFGTTFPIAVGKPGQDAMLANLNFETALCDGWNAYMEFTGEWWSRWASYSWSIAVDCSF